MDEREIDVSRKLIEISVEKAIAAYRDSPKCTLRNLVDLAAQNSTGAFQQRLFHLAQDLLGNPGCPYYELVDRVLETVDAKHLVTFGINLGYEGCSKGARTIRELEARRGFDIPWSLGFLLPSGVDGDRTGAERISRGVAQAHALGVRTFFLCAQDNPSAALDIAAPWEDCAFIVLAAPAALEERDADRLVELPHVLASVSMGNGATATCRMLEQRRLPFAIHIPYCDETLSETLDAARQALARRPLAVALVPRRQTSPKIRELVHNRVLDARLDPVAPTLFLELSKDSLAVDRIVSGDGRLAFFDDRGRLVSNGTVYEQPAYRLDSAPLMGIFRRAFPK